MTISFPTLDDMALEIADYYGVDQQEILARYRRAGKATADFVKWAHITEDEWDRRAIDTTDRAAVENFYKTTENYVFELMENWSLRVKNEMAFYVRDVLLAARIQRVLSFGCGIGQDVIYYAEAGLDVTTADLPGLTYDFAKWRFQRRQLPVESVDITSDDFLAKSYDAITSFEVFNVLVDPITTVEYLYRHIVPGGLLIYTAKFKGAYNLVPKQNEKYADLFQSELVRIGLELIEAKYLWGTGENARHLYVLRRR
jgi:2-polyprenyl-3-methyl-5-hydroxy-6-metoxy-1,4-benzoquinol methylase